MPEDENSNKPTPKEGGDGDQPKLDDLPKDEGGKDNQNGDKPEPKPPKPTEKPKFTKNKPTGHKRGREGESKPDGGKKPNLSSQAPGGATSEKTGDDLPEGTTKEPYVQETHAILKDIESDGRKAIANDPVIVPITMKNIYPCHNYDLILSKAMKPRREQAPPLEITVQPDLSKVFLVVVSRVCKTPELWSKTLNNYISRPSLIGYCMMQIYAWMIISELETSDEKSKEAKEWSSDPNKVKLLDLIRQTPTLKILDDIFSALQPTTLPNGVKVIPSFKAFSFKHDVLTIVPIHTFMHIHNTLTTMATNEKTLFMDQMLRHQPLCTVECGAPGGAVVINIGTLSGQDYGKCGFDNVMKQAFEIIVHFGALRGIKRTSDTQEYSFNKNIQYNTNNFNAIDYAMSHTTTNLRASECMARNATKYIKDAGFAGATIDERLKGRRFNNDLLQHTIVSYEQPCGYLKPRGYTFDEDLIVGEGIPKETESGTQRYLNPSLLDATTHNPTDEWKFKRIIDQHSKTVVPLDTWNAKLGNLQSKDNFYKKKRDGGNYTIDEIKTKYLKKVSNIPEFAAAFTADDAEQGCPAHRGIDFTNLHIALNESICVDPTDNPRDNIDFVRTSWNLKPSHDKVESYNERKHHRAKAIVIQTANGAKSQAIRSAMYGLVIKNLSIDGFYKHVPQPSSVEDFEACRISDACVDINNCISATDCLDDTSMYRREFQWRRPIRIDESGLPSGVACHDMSRLKMPIYPPGRNLSCTLDARPYPGLKSEIVNCLDLPAQFVGSTFDRKDRTKNYDSDMSCNQLIHLWSAYRIVVVKRKKIGENRGINKKIYYLADLQGIVGVDVKKWKVEDVMTAIQLDVGPVPLKETR